LRKKWEDLGEKYNIFSKFSQCIKYMYLVHYSTNLTFTLEKIKDMFANKKYAYPERHSYLLPFGLKMIYESQII